MATQRVQRLALIQLAHDPGSLHGVGAVAEEEVGAHDAAVFAQGCGERALGGRCFSGG